MALNQELINTLAITSAGQDANCGADQKPTTSQRTKNKKTKSLLDTIQPKEMDPPPMFLQTRLDLYEKLKLKYQERLASLPREPISITLPDGAVHAGISNVTTPGDIARGISNSLYKRTVVARLNRDSKQLWDLDRPLEQSCLLELVPFDDEDGRAVFWHSSAHILGEACERRFGCSLCIGPPVDNGFYYEMSLPGGGVVSESDWEPLESLVHSIVKEKQKFERLEISKSDLLDLFSYNKYKQHIINDKIPDGTFTTVYRNGPLVDLCRGPHVPDTGRIEAFSIMKNSSSYFLSNPENDSLQRIHGISFPDKKRMVEHKKFLEEAAKRDHRRIGQDQELFFFHPLSPGSAFWLPHGARVYNTLMHYLKEQYWKRGYQEVITPNLFNSDLWKTSGHWDYYKDDMFIIGNSNDSHIISSTPASSSLPGRHKEPSRMALKPMNCPGHCLVFGHRERTYRELPWRVADFGVLHRNEASGALSGVTRVRRFQQDDAHIFCREDQIKAEIDGLFDFLREMYGLLGFKYTMKLSTRPEKFMGEIETWDRAEKILKQSLDDFSTQPGGVGWSLNSGDGAFYGPKIDIKIFDSMNREWQCATVQLDFVQPVNFNLSYVTGEAPKKDDTTLEAHNSHECRPTGLKQFETSVPVTVNEDVVPTATITGTDPSHDGRVLHGGKLSSAPPPGHARPVMIHRAMAGSIERFMGILCEHFAGKWPFWLSPRQIMVIPVGRGFYDYAEEVRDLFQAHQMYIDVDLSGNTLLKKIALAQAESSRYNFTFIVGAEEKEGRKVNVRCRDDQSTQNRGTPVPLREALEKLTTLRNDRGMYNPFAALG
jgi:threonyl-tRNA synthetase